MKTYEDAEKVFEALTELDEDLLQEALSIDDKEKLDAVINRKSAKTVFLHPYFKRSVAACACVAFILASVLTAMRLDLFRFPLSPDHQGGVSDGSDGSDDVPGVSSSGSTTSTTVSGSGSSTTTSSKSSRSSHTTTSTGTTISKTTATSTTTSSTTGNTQDTSSEPPSSEGFSIKSMDMLNFYSAKMAISSHSPFPFTSPVLSRGATKAIRPVNIKTGHYEIDRYTEFTITSVTYFTILLNDENGFLAKKLGGTGLVEVVFTENNLDNMITFKREDRYYSCLWNGSSYNTDSANSLKSATFSTHKYIEGFHVVKNLEQENYQFTIHFEGRKVTGIDCEYFDEELTHQAVPDDMTLIEDYCIVMFVKQSFTIDQLEVYFRDENA